MEGHGMSKRTSWNVYRVSNGKQTFLTRVTARNQPEALLRAFDKLAIKRDADRLMLRVVPRNADPLEHKS